MTEAEIREVLTDPTARELLESARGKPARSRA
jgi:hypothetical protein